MGNFKIKIIRGDFCKLNSKDHPNDGEIIEFCYFGENSGYRFRTQDGDYISLIEDTDFEFLQSRESLLDMIDFSLTTKDKKWFEELLLKLDIEEHYSF